MSFLKYKNSNPSMKDSPGSPAQTALHELEKLGEKLNVPAIANSPGVLQASKCLGSMIGKVAGACMNETPSNAPQSKMF